MPITVIELIERHKESVSLCDVDEAVLRIKGESDLIVIDVRETSEYENASISAAVNIPRGFLEFRIAETCPNADQPVLIHCRTGGRAVLAAKTLSEMGYSNVGVVSGTIEDLITALE